MIAYDGVGAGKGDDFRPINREKYNKNFEDIFKPVGNPPRFEVVRTKKGLRYRRVYPNARG